MSLTEKNLLKFNKTKSSWSTESNSSFGSRKPPIIKPRAYGYQSDTTGMPYRRPIVPIGTLQSPPSSDDESTIKLNNIIKRLNKQKKNNISNDDNKPKQTQSDSEISTVNVKQEESCDESSMPTNIPDGYDEVSKDKIDELKYNTLICYKSGSTKRIICGKYFKRHNADKTNIYISKY